MEIKDKVIAMLVDAENISHKNLESIVEKMYKYGKITIRRIYGDWAAPQMENWKQELLKFSFRPIQNFKDNKNSKNSSDIALVIDAMDILYSKNIDCFILVSGDSDFVGLIRRIRESNLTVIGVGEKGKTSEELRKSCDIFEFINEKNAMDVADKLHNKKLDEIKKELLIFLEKAYKEVANEDGWALLSQLARVCKQLDPGFNPKNFNFGGYKKLFESYFSEYYEIKDHEDGGTYSVRKKNGLAYENEISC